MPGLRPLHLALLGSFALTAAALLAPAATQSQTQGPSNFVDSINGDGVSRTMTTDAFFDQTNPFFKPLGTNGRACATCHPVSQGAMITPDYVNQVFSATQGLDPLFAAVDGANYPTADMSTVAARMNSCSMLLTKGLFRIGMPIPANAEFYLQAVDDPYEYANANDISCFRRPMPATNLRFLASVMWDGRELKAGYSITDALKSQAKDAIMGHLQAAAPPTDALIAQIVAFETHLYTTQIKDDIAGDLVTRHNENGPASLINQSFFSGINDAFGLARNRQPFDSNVFALYDDWANDERDHHGASHTPTAQQLAQQSIARGEKLFNTRQFVISGVAGLNDVTGKPRITGTCSSCHSAPSVGSNALPLLMNTGISDGALRTDDMPLYTLRNKKTGKTVQTTDPGAAMTSGKWADIGKFKVPSLRGLETQSPYMHNGFSGDLLDVVNFYDTRFGIGFSAQDKADIQAFLTTL